MVFFSSDILCLELLICVTNSTSSPVQESAGSFKSRVVLLHEISSVMFHILCYFINLFNGYERMSPFHTLVG